MAKVFIACDHRGFATKQTLLKRFKMPRGLHFVDLGPAEYDPNDDYNDASIAVARAIHEHPDSFGVLICGSAHGISIQANRFKGIRAIIGHNTKLAKLGRQHNDANVICFSADFQTFAQESRALKSFLTTKFLQEERHVRRNLRLDKEHL